MNIKKEINVVIGYKDSVGVTSDLFNFLLIKAKRLNMNVNIIRPFVLFKGLFSILGFKNAIREIRDLQELEGEYIVNRPLYNILYGFYFGLYELRSKIVSKLMKKQIKYHYFGIKDIYNIENTSSFDPKTIEKIDWSSMYEYNFNLSLRNEHNPINKETMQKIGINNGDWYVCVHVRAGYFHGDLDSIRSADISNYIKAIKYIQSLGGKVVRMGDTGFFPHSEHYIDYPNSKYKSQYMDLYLIKHCKFYIGTSSGIFSTAWLLHKPILAVNVSEFLGMPTVKKIDKIIYKYIVNDKTGKIIPYKKVFEYVENNFLNGIFKLYDFSKINCSIMDNTDNDILLAVQEFIINLEKNMPKKDSNMDKEVKKLVYSYIEKNDALDVEEKYRLSIHNLTNGGVCDFFEKKYFDF